MGYHTRMQSVLEFAPVAVFGVAYYLHGIYTATAALMISMAVLLLVDLAWHRRIPTMHALSALLVFAFGAATLILHNQRFIEWKPTVLFWLVSLAFLGSFWIGERTLTERLLGSALGEPVSVSQQVWRRLNGASVAFYALLGGLNLLVAFNASERTWVNFKLFGLSSATVVFAALQLTWLARQLPREATT
jgi:intracellular septation protein